MKKVLSLFHRATFLYTQRTSCDPSFQFIFQTMPVITSKQGVIMEIRKQVHCLVCHIPPPDFAQHKYCPSFNLSSFLPFLAFPKNYHTLANIVRLGPWCGLIKQMIQNRAVFMFWSALSREFPGPSSPLLPITSPPHMPSFPSLPSPLPVWISPLLTTSFQPFPQWHWVVSAAGNMVEC